MRMRWREASRWMGDQVNALLMAIHKDPPSFEKPTARRYYTNIAEDIPLLQDVSWTTMRDKMRYLRMKHRSAVKWRDNVGPGLTGNAKEQTIRDYVLKLCPQFDLLDPIFGSGTGLQPSLVLDTVGSDNLGDVGTEEVVLEDSDDPIESCDEAETPLVKRRKRRKEHGRWSEEQVNALMMAIHQNLRRFETPTAKVYYKKIARKVPLLRVFEWTTMRDKMRYLRLKHRSAVEWRDNTGAELTGDEKEQTIREHILKLCPLFDSLDPIFGYRTDLQPSLVLDTVGSDHLGDVGTEEVVLEDSDDPMESCHETGIWQNKMRKRRKEHGRWSEEQETALLKVTSQDPSRFEKPTARCYYNKITVDVPLLQDFEWRTMRDKMKYLRTKYRSAVEWLANTGAELTGDDKTLTIRENILKLCPQFDSLDRIYRIRTGFQPSLALEAYGREHIGDYGREVAVEECGDLIQNHTEGSNEQRGETRSPPLAHNVGSDNMCPQFDLLDRVYRSRTSFQPSLVLDPVGSDHLGDVGTEVAVEECGDLIQNHTKGPDEQRGETRSPPLSPNVVSSRSETPDLEDCKEQLTEKTAEVGGVSKEGEGTASSSISQLAQMNEDSYVQMKKKMELEDKKIELEREKFQWQRQKEQKELELEQKRLDIEEIKTRGEIRLEEKKLEVEAMLKKEEMKHKFEIEKLKMEMEMK